MVNDSENKLDELLRNCCATVTSDIYRPFFITGSVQCHTWTSAKKAALYRQFDILIKVGKTPGQVDCLNDIRMEKSLSTFTWRHVKFAVKNIITSRQRCCKK